MARYEYDEMITLYIIIYKTTEGNIIQGWAANKTLAEAYMEFHNCPKFSMKKVKKFASEFRDIIEDKHHNEIVLSNIYTRSQKNKHKYELVTVPVTEAEMVLIEAESNEFFSSHIRYDFLDQSLFYLKGKYLRALQNIFLTSVIGKVIHNRSDEFVLNVKMDQLKILYESFPDQFG